MFVLQFLSSLTSISSLSAVLLFEDTHPPAAGQVQQIKILSHSESRYQQELLSPSSSVTQVGGVDDVE